MTVAKFLKDIEKEEQNFLKAPIYIYGTEAIGVYYEPLELEGKSVLTINGSGDQVLNAYYFGAKRVVGFDVVKSTKYMLDLKIAAIRTLSYMEFLDFFGDKSNIGNFNYDTYSSLEKYLEDETKAFFNNLFKEYNYDGQKLLSSNNFRKRKEFYVNLDRINPFLANEQNYIKMQEIISNINFEFIKADIQEVHKKVKGTFDIINLSNVLNYISKDLVKRAVDKPLSYLYKEVILNLRSKLNKGGKIIFYRFYRTVEEIGDMPLINREPSLKWMAEQDDFKVYDIEFEGILHGKDAINILELQ